MKGDRLPNFNPDLLNLPPADLKIVRRNGVFKVFDRLRKQYFILTPEEYVRQRFVAWLLKEKNYPESLMANEIGITLNQTYKRCDTIVYSKTGKPLVIIEFKAPNVEITQNAFNQIVRYNMVLKAPILIVSNGVKHFCCLCNPNFTGYQFLDAIPPYEEINSWLIENNDC